MNIKTINHIIIYESLKLVSLAGLIEERSKPSSFTFNFWALSDSTEFFILDLLSLDYPSSIRILICDSDR